MRDIPYTVDDDWLEALLEDPHSCLINASTILKFLKEKGSLSY